ncbi:triose-phosphate isomerase family protein [Rathayibacter soli]|uniref:triose-phosphate isomerase family protein n=1 Tax=Rathayibacter soli TaxID=3144168 RepID=UPI0027E45980|nr:triose-phosphate isomerase family protein [Glaciibacter superstes]
MAPITVGVSLKMYFGHRRGAEWCAAVADLARTHPAVVAGAVELFVVPGYLQILPALEAFAGTTVRIGAQDVAAEDAGPFTGEVSPAELAELGVLLAEIGHAERRRLFCETDAVVAAKTAAALRNGLTPVLCVGEADQVPPTEAARATVTQLQASLDGAPHGAVIVAYEPVWAIGAPEPAPDTHITTVTRAVRDAVRMLPGRAGSTVIYGGSAGPGLFDRIGEHIDGLFLGRFAHDPATLAAVLDEASRLACCSGGP